MATATPSRRVTAGSRTSTVRTRTAAHKAHDYLSAAQKQELEGLNKVSAKVTSNKKEAVAFLQRAGILGQKGQVLKAFR